LVLTDRLDPESVDVVFLALPHGESRAWLAQNPLSDNVRIIDLSSDFRLGAQEEGFVYGLPEAFRQGITQSRRVANPGCFATAMQLALLPLARAGLLAQSIHVSGITGSTGAGAGLSDTGHFTWRADNVQVYKPFSHQHLGEVTQTLGAFTRPLPEIVFIPHRGPFTRGILVSCWTETGLEADALRELYQTAYAQEPFVWVSTSVVDLKQVTGTNHCYLQVQQQGRYSLVVAVIDNLLKGAAGQAVQNLNLMNGWPEDTGLHLKPTAY
jgi:N-acetyl-gamma-glutamyl-phosphate reductase